MQSRTAEGRRPAGLFQARERRRHGVVLPSLETSAATAEPRPSWPRKLNCIEVGPASKMSCRKRLWETLPAHGREGNVEFGGLVDRRSQTGQNFSETKIRSQLPPIPFISSAPALVPFASGSFLRTCPHEMLLETVRPHFGFTEAEGCRQLDQGAHSSQAIPWPCGAAVAVAAAQGEAEGGWVGQKNQGGAWRSQPLGPWVLPVPRLVPRLPLSPTALKNVGWRPRREKGVKIGGSHSGRIGLGD